jgi:hypothetical protein
LFRKFIRFSLSRQINHYLLHHHIKNKLVDDDQSSSSDSEVEVEQSEPDVSFEAFVNDIKKKHRLDDHKDTEKKEVEIAAVFLSTNNRKIVQMLIKRGQFVKA